jgi:molecular chaperone Hsp33
MSIVASDIEVRGLADDGWARVVVVVTTELVQEAASRHQCRGLAAAALGKGLTSGLLLASAHKGSTHAQQRVTLQLRGDGPLGGVTADVTPAGEGTRDVRGYVVRPDAELAGPAAEGAPRRRPLVQAIGRHGVVHVLRDLGLKDRYGGQSALVTGEIDEDVEAYLRQSEQIESALGCEVVLDDDGKVAMAAGLLVQLMPAGQGPPAGGAATPTGLLRDVQHRLRTGVLFDALVEHQATLDGGQLAAVLLAALLPDSKVQILDRTPLRFHCHCSMDRVEEMLLGLGAAELQDMLAQDQGAEVICNFCNDAYRFGAEALELLIEKASEPQDPSAMN